MNTKIFASLVATTLFASTAFYTSTKEEKAIQAKNILEQKIEKIKKGELPISPWLKMVGLSLDQTHAEGDGDPTCEAILSDARTQCQTAWTEYAHGALKYFNGTLCRFNNETGANVENVLCHFRKSMGINVDLSALPMTSTKTMGSMTVVVTIAEPVESWALTAGYEAKGTVTVNGTTYMTLYWGGTAEATKGFMIEGFVANGLGGNRAGYLKWDLTGETQEFKMYGTEFPSGTYLTSAASTGDSYRGDTAIYGAVSYNTTSKEVSTQVVLIEEQRFGGTAGSFGCFRMYAAGVKEGTVTVAKTQNSLNGTGHSISSPSYALDDMDGVQLTDSVSTANGTSDASYTSQSQLETAFSVTSGASLFHVSCDDLSTANQSSGIFSTSTYLVDKDKAVDDVF